MIFRTIGMDVDLPWVCLSRRDNSYQMGATSEHDDVQSSIDVSEQQESSFTIRLPVIIAG